MKSRKQTYKLLGNLKYAVAKMWKLDRWRTSLMFIHGPIDVILSVLGILLSTLVVEYAQGDKSPTQVVVMVCSICVAILIVTILSEFCVQNSFYFKIEVDNSFSIEFIEHHCNKDYQISESASGLDRANKALNNTGTDSAPCRVISENIAQLFKNIWGIVMYSGILFHFHMMIPGVIIITTIVSFYALKKVAIWGYQNREKWSGLDRKIDYVNGTGVDFSVAKDIRLYGLGEWFLDVFDQVIVDRMRWSKKEQIYNFKIDLVTFICSLVRDLVVYSVLVYAVFQKEMNSTSFIFYFGIVTGFTVYVSSLAQVFSRLVASHLGICEIREFIEYPNKDNHGTGIELPSETFSVEFKDVSFTHEGSEEATIEQFNLSMKKGEKLAIVGMNGAGKTTLVKLLCGLYKPTKGEILVNGHNIQAYNIEEYHSLYSAVFQDIFILPFSVGTNIAGTETYDQNKMEEVLKQVDLWDKVMSLPNKIDTPLVKTVQYDAVDLSGGEMQKLALARALYKNGKFLVLDEPTAALDPIAESNIYQTYHEMTKDCSSIFISHRLASTRFCDRIILLEHGRIIEEGTHESLMSYGGEYSKLFEVQSHYYKEGGNTNEA